MSRSAYKKSILFVLMVLIFCHNATATPADLPEQEALKSWSSWFHQGVKDWGTWAYKGSKDHLKNNGNSYIAASAAIYTFAVLHYSFSPRTISDGEGGDFEANTQTYFPCFQSLQSCYNDLVPLTKRYGMPWGLGQVEYIFRNGTMAGIANLLEPNPNPDCVENFLIQRTDLCGLIDEKDDYFSYQLVNQQGNVCRYMFTYVREGYQFPMALTDWISTIYK